MKIKSPTLNKVVKQTNDPAYQINKLARTIHKDADEHALWDDFREAMKKYGDDPDCFALASIRYYATSVVAGEVSELRRAWENKDHYAEEMADVLISLLSTAVEMDIDIGTAVVRKMAINHKRPKRHGKENCFCLTTKG